MNINEYPLCKNCKYFIEKGNKEMPINQVCGLSAVEPITGQWARRPKLAAAFRRDTGPCGIEGKFFIKGEAIVKPDPMPEPKKIEEPKEEPKTIEVSVPEVVEEPKEELKEGELLPLEPGQKRRRRKTKAD